MDFSSQTETKSICSVVYLFSIVTQDDRMCMCVQIDYTHSTKKTFNYQWFGGPSYKL